jgi:hypothetical protein
MPDAVKSIKTKKPLIIFAKFYFPSPITTTFYLFSLFKTLCLDDAYPEIKKPLEMQEQRTGHTSLRESHG